LIKDDGENVGGLISLGQTVFKGLFWIIVFILVVVLWIGGGILAGTAFVILLVSILWLGFILFYGTLFGVIPYTIKGIILLLTLPGYWVPTYVYLPAEVLLVVLVLWWREKATANP
jgi:hypothetical protein